jgi:hypothetical protein
MKTKWIITAAATALLGFSATVQATPITGSIGFLGSFTQVGGTAGNLGTATSFTINSPALVGATDDLTGATLNSFVASVNVNPATPMIGQLWSVLVGVTTYTFQVTTEAQTLGAGNTTLTLAGSGILKDGTAADDTAGDWTLAFGVSGASFRYLSTSANTVPDGGTTVLLLGAALSGLGLLRKKLAA